MKDLSLVMLPNLVLFNPTMYYNIGVLYLAAMAEQAGFSVQIVDMRGGEKPIPPSRHVGFSCTTPEIVEAKRLASQVEAKTIVGGAHPTLFPEDCIDSFDYVVKGEGEYALIDILKKRENSGLVTSPRILDLDSLPLPAWHLLPNPFSEELFPGERYGKGQKAATLIASRGCPYSCAYCANYLRTPVVYRGVNSIVGELEALMRKKVVYFRFEDDNFTLHPEFTLLCRSLMELGIHYKCHTRANLLTPELATLMYASGCEECGMGVESADDAVLKLNNKHITVEDNRRAVRILKDAGIRAKTYFVAGLPGETEASIEKCMQFILDCKPDKWTLSTFTPYPGSPVYAHPERFGVKILNKDWTVWWNFVDRFNHELTNASADVLYERYQRLYKFMKETVNGK